MEFAYKPDYARVKARYDAFWARAVLDRPPVSITLEKPDARPFPVSGIGDAETAERVVKRIAAWR